jgi:hypothetical protein
MTVMTAVFMMALIALISLACGGFIMTTLMTGLHDGFDY